MSYFEKNIQAIKDRDIVLYDQLQLKQEQMIDRVMSEPAKDGNTYLKVYINGTWIALNSTYRPIVEAEKYASKYQDLPLFGRVLFLGFGNGYVARALSLMHDKQLETGTDVVNASRKYAFYEPDAAIFIYVMQVYDISDILKNEDISIFVEGLNANLLAGWCSDYVGTHNENSFYLGALPKYKENYADAYERMTRVYNDTIKGIAAYRNTQNLFAKTIANNNIFNIKYFEKAMNMKWFAANYPKDLPYVIVAAGPSLKQRVDMLKVLQGKAFIMVVDTAAEYLLDQGIQPDGVMGIDCEKELYLFSREMQNIPFFLHTDVNRLVLDKVEPQYPYFMVSNMKYYQMLAEERDDGLLDLSIGGSVANAAFSLATALGVTDIILVGQDLAIQPDATHIVSRNGLKMDMEHTLDVPGNEEDMVTTLPDFYIYLQWFQKEIAKHSRIHVWNVTAGGAKIEGARYVKPDEVLERFAKQDIVYADFQEKWEQKKKAHDRIKDTTETEQLDQSIYWRIVDRVSELYSDLEQGREVALQLSRLCEKQEMDHVRFAKLNHALDQISQRLCSIPEFEFVELYCADLEDDMLHNLYEEQDDKQKELKQIYEKLHRYYEVMAASEQEVIHILKEAMQ